MSQSPIIEGVYLSSRFDLKEMYADYFAPYADRIRLRSPAEIDDPKAIRFALTWLPADDAFEPYPNVKLACSIAAGVDSIVNCPSLPDDVFVTRVQDESQADLMAGFAAWHVIWHHRNMGFYLDRQKQARWEHQNFDAIVPPADYTVGILGYGLMGKAIAAAVAAMGFPVIAAVRRLPDEAAPEGISFQTGADAIMRTAARSNALINILPLTDATRGVLNADLFQAMPKGAKLIQLGRGQHLVEKDLVPALDCGQLSGASLDVFHIEPLPADHPWWADERIVITPHQASDSAKTLMAEQVARSAVDTAEGRQPRFTVDRAQGY